MTPLRRGLTAEREVVVDGQPARVVFDLLGAQSNEIDGFLVGYSSGYLAGVERGRQLADDEASTLWREAARIVHAMSRIDPHVERERRRRECQADLAERRAHEARPWGQEATQ